MISYNLEMVLRLRGITQKKFAGMIGWSESQISKYMAGEKEPKYSDIVKISSSLNMDPSDLISTCPSVDLRSRGVIKKNFIVRPIMEDGAANALIVYLYIFNGSFSLAVKDIMAGGSRGIILIKDGHITVNGNDYFCGNSYHISRSTYQDTIFFSKGARFLFVCNGVNFDHYEKIIETFEKLQQ